MRNHKTYLIYCLIASMISNAVSLVFLGKYLFSDQLNKRKIEEALTNPSKKRLASKLRFSIALLHPVQSPTVNEIIQGFKEELTIAPMLEGFKTESIIEPEIECSYTTYDNSSDDGLLE